MARLMLKSRSILSGLNLGNINSDLTLGNISPRIVHGFKYGNNVAWCTSQAFEEEPKKQKTSKAMKAYLQRATEYDNFIRDQLLQYNVGKRHLANMMGEDPETFTQQDIDRAIEYLFPSGLFDRKARPVMKPPEEIFPPKKAAEFDKSGRPYHFLFYTGKPNYHKLLYDVVENLNSLNKFEDSMIRKHLTPDSSQTLNMLGTNWLPVTDLQLLLMETLNEQEYEHFVLAMERLLNHSYSYKVKDFIDKYRKAIMSRGKTFDIPKPQYDADGRAYVTVKECMRKTARGEVTLRVPGTGKFTINNKGLEYFPDLQNREQVKACSYAWCDGPRLSRRGKEVREGITQFIEP